MPVLLRSQLDHTRGSRTNLTSRPSGLLHPPSHEAPSFPRTLGGIKTRRDSNQSATNVSRRTVVSVIEFPQLLPPPSPRKKGILANVKLCYRKLHLKDLLPLTFMMFYMVIGAVLFLWIEGAADLHRRSIDFAYYRRERELFLKRMEEIYVDRAAAEPLQRRLFLEEAIDYFHQQISVTFTNQTDWSLTTALYYSGTVFTTIGYGDVSCYTVSGRIMTVLYAIVGIPLMLITLNDLGKFLYKAINGVVKLAKSAHPFTFATKQNQADQVDIMERGGQNPPLSSTPQVEFQLSLDGDELLTVESNEEDVSPIEKPGPPPPMPVTVAIGITVGWIFFCAGLFKIWEHEWTYAESCYFMFISLSTIGLGDIAVKRRDLMVICFVFVIIGLSLVSMCINVIQSSLEDLYMKLLMKLLLEYQSKLAQGSDSVGASVGMMKIWGENRTAKYLMPLLSKSTRMTAMAKVQEEAESKGIEIPPIFSDLDEDSGIPKILSIPNEESNLAIQDAVFHAEHSATLASRISPPLISMPTIVFYDSDTQTDNPTLCEKTGQTDSAEMHDSGICTEIRFADCLSCAVQCDEWETVSEQTQTTSVETSDTEMMTFCEPSSESAIQTERITTKEQHLQTHLVDYLECDAQTEIVEYKCEIAQTPHVDLIESEIQTDEIEVKAKSRQRRGRRRDGRRSADPSTPHNDEQIGEEEVQEKSSSSNESLDWNPIDGMHAERQRPVRDLTRFFDRRIRERNERSPGRTKS